MEYNEWNEWKEWNVKDSKVIIGEMISSQI
jgi:hypothetical protein